MTETVTRSTCCYCGVGCGVLITEEGSRVIAIEGDPQHPANFGRLCSKGRSLPLTVGDHVGRVLAPQMRAHRDLPRVPVSWDVALQAVAERFTPIIAEHGPDAVAFYVSGQLLTEDYYVFNKLAKGLIGTNNIDTNSRLCMSSAVTGYKLAFGADGPPGCYDDLDAARTVVFAGSNMAYAHPVLFRRLEAARERDPTIRWIAIDPRRTDTAALADLHLQIAPGSDVALFNGMLHHLIATSHIDARYVEAHTNGFEALKEELKNHTPKWAADCCGIAERDLIQAAEWFAESPAALSLYCMGLNQSSHGTAKNLALINLHLACGQIGRAGTGPFSLTGQPNAMGGREVGGMATMLAAHRDISNPLDRADLARLWGVESVSDRPGLPAVALFDALRSGQVKAVWIVCTNPAHSMPDLAHARAALSAAEFVVVQEAFLQADTVACADVLLPATTWGEKDGTVTNSERRISRVRAAIPPPGEARADWWIAKEVAKRMERLCVNGFRPLFGFSDVEEVFNEHRMLTVGRDLDIGGLSYDVLDANGPQQWPYPNGSTVGQKRRYTDGRFETPDQRARFHPTPFHAVAESVDRDYPFNLISGRLRDQWHGMSRSARNPHAFDHAPDPAVTMHPINAEALGVSQGDLVKLISRRGELVLPIDLSTDMAPGTVFAAMHWSGQFLNSGGINEVTHGTVDQRSFQPELKHSAVRVEPMELPWRVYGARLGDGLAMQAALQPLLSQCGYAAISYAGENLVTFSAACEEPSPTWLDAVQTALGLTSPASVLEYRDAARHVTKRAHWANGTLTGFLLAGDTAGAQAMVDLLREQKVWVGSRSALFAHPGLAPPMDRTICQCMQVKASRIDLAIAAGAILSELKTTLRCGTVCGSCVPEIQRKLDAVRATA